MEIRRYLGVLRRRWFLIVITALVAAGIAWTTTDRSLRYVATTTLYVGMRDFTGPGDNPILESDDFFALDRITYTFSLLLNSRVVASDAILRAGVDRSAEGLAAATTATPIAGSQLLEVTVTDSDPVIARALSIALAEAFVARVTELEPASPQARGDADVLPTGIPVAVFERAPLPTAPAPIGLLSRMAVFTIFGIVIAAAAIFAVEYLDVTLKGPSDTERVLNVPVLASVPIISGELSLAGRVRAELAHPEGGADAPVHEPTVRGA